MGKNDNEELIPRSKNLIFRTNYQKSNSELQPELNWNIKYVTTSFPMSICSSVTEQKKSLGTRVCMNDLQHFFSWLYKVVIKLQQNLY